jgi:hypothetical protein
MTVSPTTAVLRMPGEGADDQMMDSVAQAVRDASKTAVQHATTVKSAMTGSGLIGSVSRVSYNGAYAIAFGLVYTVVFVTQFIPQDNPVMDGLSDGARAAIDAVKGV